MVVEATVDQLKQISQQFIRQGIRPHYDYLAYVVRHKQLLWKYGRALRVGRWRCLVHDWSKFLPSIWGPMVQYFDGPKVPTCRTCLVPLQESDHGWTCQNLYCTQATLMILDVAMQPTPEAKYTKEVALQKHYLREDHHWQAWVLLSDGPSAIWKEVLHQDGTLLQNNETRQTIGRLSIDFAPTNATALVSLLNRLPRPQEMPEQVAREMVADWLATAAMNDANARVWYMDHRYEMILHTSTRAFVERLLTSAGQT